MLLYLYIALGSAIGGMFRYWCTSVAVSHFDNSFPWGLLIVNITGSFIIGCMAAFAFTGKPTISPDIQKFITVGVCGGYTSFSSFSLDTLELLQNEEFLKAGANIILSLVLCLLSVFIGYILVSTITTK